MKDRLELEEEKVELEEKVVYINRVSRVVKGGRRFSFSALVVVGDKKGQVGMGLGKANEVSQAVEKGVKLAKKYMISVPMYGNTIPHSVIGHFGKGRVLLKPASPGTGIVAGGAVRAIMGTAGVRDILTKSLGSNNPINVSYATMEGLKKIKLHKRMAELRKQLRENEEVKDNIAKEWYRKNSKS